MVWSDIVMITASSTLMNHMGLVEAVEGVIRHKLPIVNCSKCCSFWCCLVYALLSGVPVIPSVAVSFGAAYAAVWFELLLGYIDTLYIKFYESLYPQESATAEDTETEVS